VACSYERLDVEPDPKDSSKRILSISNVRAAAPADQYGQLISLASRLPRAVPPSRR